MEGEPSVRTRIGGGVDGGLDQRAVTPTQSGKKGIGRLPLQLRLQEYTTAAAMPRSGSPWLTIPAQYIQGAYDWTLEGCWENKTPHNTTFQGFGFPEATVKSFCFTSASKNLLPVNLIGRGNQVISYRTLAARKYG